ncbi:hypothetical protein NL676_008301 [Syzygium grande]|nr:hypothetical protein NL676_008301 [Syzygium grande]
MNEPIAGKPEASNVDVRQIRTTSPVVAMDEPVVARPEGMAKCKASSPDLEARRSSGSRPCPSRPWTKFWPLGSQPRTLQPRLNMGIWALVAKDP